MPNSGEIYVFGNNTYGQLGLADNNPRNAPTRVTSYGPLSISGISGALGGPIAKGSQHTLALARADATHDQSQLYACGASQATWDYGQRGTAWLYSQYPLNFHSVSVPQNTIQKVVAGSNFTLALLWNGDVYGQGISTLGQLGIGSSLNGTSATKYFSPTFITGDVSDLSAFGMNNHSLFLSRKGLIYGCGQNLNGELGLGYAGGVVDFPTLISTSHFSGVAAGSDHSLFLRHDNEVYACGKGNYGQLGDGSLSNSSSLVRVTGSVSKVFANEKHSFFLDTSRTLYGCGLNTDGCLGLGDTIQRNVPIEVSGSVDYVAAGQHHTLMLSRLFTSNYYHTWSCGRNTNGQLGLNDTTSRYAPTKVLTNLGNGVQKDGISAGAAYSLFTKYNSTNPLSYFCGAYYAIAGEPDRLVPTAESGNIRQAAAGIVSAVYLTDYHTTLGASTVTGSLFGIGQNTWGNLGLGHTSSPVADPTYATGTRHLDFSSVSAGQYSSFFLLKDGTFYSCGLNYEGVLGRGENFVTYNPNNLPTLTGILSSDIVSMEGGHEFSLILTSGGDVYSCGESKLYPAGYGTLGLGPQEEARRPTYVTGDVKAISAGNVTSLFLKNDGYAYGCGKVDSLGLNPSDFPNEVRRPTVISGDVAAISAGVFNSFFVSTAGSVYVQGDNQFKQSAFASVGVPGWSPQHVTSGPAGFDGNITSISAGAHTLFLKNDGTLYSCGNNDAGQLGLGIVGPVGGRYQPTVVTTNVSQAEVGAYHSVILKTNGQAYTFGTGGQGQLGDGTTVDKWTPTYVTGASNPVAKVTAGNFRTTFLNHSNDAYSCGQYPLGVPGTSSAFHYVPTYISGNITGMGRADYDQNSFVDSSGELYVLGKDQSCSLGLGNDPAAGSITVYHSTRVPGPYSSFLPIVKIVSNQQASLFLTADGDCYSCGFYQHGNLGRLNYDLEPPGYGRDYYPQFVTGSVVDINASEGICMGLVGSDGYAYAYGYNSYGMMGLGTAAKNTAVWLPTRISGNVASISFGATHAAFLTPGGDIYAAGYNSKGELGDGTTTERTSPVRVSGNSTGVFCGANYSLFTSKDGNVYSCGQNNNGQLGLGDNTDRHLPTKIIIP